MALLDLIPGVTTLRNICIGICVTAACTSFAGLYGYHKGKVKAEAIAAQKALAIASQRETEARVASENYRALEARWNEQKQEIEIEQAKQLKARDEALSSNRAELGRLRLAIAAASRGSPTSQTTTPSEPNAAPTGTGSLFSECAGALTEMGDAADRLSDQVRGLQEFEASP